MLKNNNTNTEHVKFVSYTGKCPSLCMGVLALNIDGEDYFFGRDHKDYSNKCGWRDYDKYVEEYEKDGRHFINRFWRSGGSAYFDNEWNDYVNNGEWVIEVDNIPEQFRAHAIEIDYIFNKNVPHGCCGGCL